MCCCLATHHMNPQAQVTAAINQVVHCNAQYVPACIQSVLAAETLVAQEVVKGSQGAGKVDESLDRTKMDVDADPGEGTSGAAPRPPPAGARKKKGRR